MPEDYWLDKCDETDKLKEERNVIRLRLREGEGVRSELLKVSEDMRQRLGELATGYVVLDNARDNFLMYLQERGVVSEYWWQALEEFAEGAAGGLSLYWPPPARRDYNGQLPPPHLAFLHSPPPGLASKPPLPIVVIPPRHASSTVSMASEFDVPPPYTPSQQQAESTAALPESLHARHSANSAHCHLFGLDDLDDLDDERAASQPDL
ncbi:hypothetical protein RTG_01855 [Rhodotorula toruloides ATCC 204091]|uniref:Uncharacterized protein n=1 Tax=Rhodotorula toruloides TaxID=5286 RepID=A0A0K3C930_RHOTO|nr:hypothetical protein RTG_01855 [Rhodotorula toruloides ATCC 204091]KAK4334619.1 hypothetical protein RTBOTA2_003374 [Rhodotorula toruloides]PRQ76514.1 hypothetical protein AAT19DRAFT_11932 [Rhodotorula toruloides]